MVPPGGTHIRHRLVKDAARLLKVDYADAVTGFQFKGRHGTAIVEGAVVAEQFAEAIQAVIDGFEDAQVEEEPRARSLAALRQWKRFLTGLRIAERVSAYGDGSKGDEEDFDDVQADEPTEAPDIEPGGFFPGVAEEDVLPTAGRFTVGELNVKPRPARQKREAIDDDSDDDLSLVADDYHEPSERYATAGQAPTYESDQGGGFMVEEQEEQKSAGGFLPDADGHGHEDGAFAGGPGGFSTEADHGGRYVTDDPGDDESGGGFLPDEDEDNSEGGSSFVKGARLTEEYGQVGGFPAEEGRGSGDNPDESDTFHTLRAKSEDMVEEVVAIATVPSSGFEVDGANDDSTMANGDTSKMSDSESLPSRDPDDEELEPDWLESD
jgi:xeroderma pigmentosum group C-complementing protein